MKALVYSVLYFTHSQCLCVAAGSALRAADAGECPARSVVSVFVLQARPMVERQHAVRERARVTPAAQTGLQRDRQTDRQRGVRLKAYLFQRLTGDTLLKEQRTTSAPLVS